MLTWRVFAETVTYSTQLAMHVYSINNHTSTGPCFPTTIKQIHIASYLKTII